MRLPKLSRISKSNDVIVTLEIRYVAIVPVLSVVKTAMLGGGEKNL
jgi:hypothetical protein